MDRLAAGLNLHNLASVTPTLWTTLDPAATVVADIAWADPVSVSAHDPQPLGSTSGTRRTWH